MANLSSNEYLTRVTKFKNSPIATDNSKRLILAIIGE